MDGSHGPCRVMLLLTLAITLLPLTCKSQKLSIGLHAQVDPSGGKIVGSVITTDGLKSAFYSRPEVEHVELFYPMQYTRLFSRPWDLIVVEGWFPAIDDFLHMVRLNSKHTLVFFFCLDPIFPGLVEVANMDIDGLLTNSRIIEASMRNRFPTEFVMLAADPLHMKPMHNISRDWGAVYVGAGGGMIHAKYLLLDMLMSAAPFNLRLHGSHWDEIPQLAGHWLGALPREKIPDAYSSAHVVLASTTDEQRQAEMINNRVFEALSCGGIVISEHNPAVVSYFEDIVVSIKHGVQVRNMIPDIIDNAETERIISLRWRGREAIVRRHTWHHRVVSIMGLFHRLMWAGGARAQVGEGKQLVARCKHSPKLAWIVSAEVSNLGDYSVVRHHVTKVLSIYYCITVVEEEEWLKADISEFSSYDVLMLHARIYDKIDIKWREDGGGVARQLPLKFSVQKVIGYLYGIQLADVGQDRMPYSDISHYDVIWYRDLTDIEAIQQSTSVTIPPARLQHVFGAGPGELSAGEEDESLQFTVVSGPDEHIESRPPGNSKPLDVVVLCIFTQRELCISKNIRSYVGDVPYMLLLSGGTWEAWMAAGILGDDDVDVHSDDSVSAYLGMIARCIHITDGNIGDAEGYIGRAEQFLYLYRAPALDGAAEVNSADDNIWPLVAAATGHTKIRIVNENRRLGNLIREIGAWSLSNLRLEVRRGLSRLVGMPKSDTSISITYPSNNSVVADAFLTADHLKEYVSAEGSSFLLPVYISYSNIALGRDGQCCVLVNGGSRLCLHRNTRDLTLKLKWPPMSRSPIPSLAVCESILSEAHSGCPNTRYRSTYDPSSSFLELNIQLLLQGTVFAEKAYSSHLRVFIPLCHSHYCFLGDAGGGLVRGPPPPEPPILSHEKLSAPVLLEALDII